MLKCTDVSEVRTASIIRDDGPDNGGSTHSETSLNFNVTTRRYIPEDSKLHSRYCENLKSHIFFLLFIEILQTIELRGRHK
jgi:hypothetical protein